ncbi:hypothetical protein [Piscinibacter gummiphilus]|uniref:Uncharacterized protein n=1 Tax=Piscinibacter gummiphilus TaxID=946333 RepID=A0A1W6L633_9BURK|nr:hypothetical protein [Piscinibacter gummiphilus]ARN19640.1 hypothetical protein A4W93_06745 [Piscinibacter gummiphilus]ATU64310.1 hypothetical protein CPZ87_06830 [Piscinibacter gummiphilus]GLS93510.1 hypothetical protein GCM10007918_08010 [Piscinibacter gummiphilus]
MENLQPTSLSDADTSDSQDKSSWITGLVVMLGFATVGAIPGVIIGAVVAGVLLLANVVTVAGACWVAGISTAAFSTWAARQALSGATASHIDGSTQLGGHALPWQLTEDESFSAKDVLRPYDALYCGDGLLDPNRCSRGGCWD